MQCQRIINSFVCQNLHQYCLYKCYSHQPTSPLPPPPFRETRKKSWEMDLLIHECKIHIPYLLFWYNTCTSVWSIEIHEESGKVTLHHFHLQHAKHNKGVMMIKDFPAMTSDQQKKKGVYIALSIFHNTIYVFQSVLLYQYFTICYMFSRISTHKAWDGNLKLKE